ncbi:hypothetical protein C8R43DRAFT_1241144 [Mycena crocata]|nr:hypothetical protein C8R43DRAFT_1241144 [Mycena crocata]
MSKLVLRCSWVANRLDRRRVVIHLIGKHYTTEERKRHGGPGRPGLRELSTIQPSLLIAEDFVDLSGRRKVSIRFPFTLGRGSNLTYDRPWTLPKAVPFPPGCQGFLYYDYGICGASLSGSVRFRVTASNNPVYFPAGRNLLLPSGFPWQLSLPLLAKNRLYSAICQQLLQEGLATESVLSLCRTVIGKRRIHSHCTLYHVDSVFLVEFTATLHLTIVGSSLHGVDFAHIFRIQSKVAEGTSYFPWSGTALARLEPSTRPKFAGHRVLHLRILKILQPVACTVQNYRGRILQPIEGELYTVGSHQGVPEPWAYDIDGKSKNATALRALWDMSGLRGFLATESAN